MTTAANGRIIVSIDRGIGHVVLDRPSHKNALSKAMCLELIEAFDRLDTDPEVSVVTLSGRGGNFCAGAGLDQFDEILFDGAAGDDDPARGANESSNRPDGIDRLSQADAALRAVRKPTIALVEGICMGGGWQIAAAADVVLASTNVRIAITPSKLGIIYPRPGLERLAERVGLDRAKYLLLTASEVTPQQAEQWGLITVLLDAGTFDKQSASIVTTIRSRSLFSNASHKQLLEGYASACAGSSSRSGYSTDWTRTWSEFRTGSDLAEGRRAFAAKEQPAFPWRLEDEKSM